MSGTLKDGDRIRCPGCGGPQEDAVEDFVVPGRIGHVSEQEHDCPHCGAFSSWPASRQVITM